MHFSAKHEARDDLGCVATQAISPYAVRNDPRIQPSWDTKRKDARVADQIQKSEDGLRGSHVPSALMSTRQIPFEDGA
eukprot:14864484-Ditylum_brightwellii.AAC.1